MEFETLIDTFLVYKNNPLKFENKICYTKQGKIHYKYYNNDVIAIYCISIYEKRTGIFTNLINTIISSNLYNKVCILGVGSSEMIGFLKKYEYDGIQFYDKGGDFIWSKI
jgi:hypothetical protein